MHERWAVIHPTYGVFIGFCQNLLCFTLVDTAQQRQVYVVASPDDLLSQIQPAFPDCTAVPVRTAAPSWASVQELLDAGVNPRFVEPLWKFPTHHHPTMQ